MKIAFIAAILTLAICASSAPPTIDQYIQFHGAPALVATDFDELQNQKLITVAIYGLNQDPLSNLDTHGSRVLIYGSDKRFLRHIRYHFEDLFNPEAHVGWTMFASMTETNLKVVQFDDKGDFESERSMLIEVAYLEEGQKGSLIRINPRQDMPNK